MAADIAIDGEPQLVEGGQRVHFAFVNRGDAPLAAGGRLAHISLSTSDDGGRPVQTIFGHDETVMDELSPNETFGAEVDLGLDSLADGLYTLQAAATVDSSVLRFHVHDHRATVWNGEPAAIPADMRFHMKQATVYFTVTFDGETADATMQQHLSDILQQALDADGQSAAYSHGDVQVWLSDAQS